MTTHSIRNRRTLRLGDEALPELAGTTAGGHARTVARFAVPGQASIPERLRPHLTLAFVDDLSAAITHPRRTRPEEKCVGDGEHAARRSARTNPPPPKEPENSISRVPFPKLRQSVASLVSTLPCHARVPPDRPVYRVAEPGVSWCARATTFANQSPGCHDRRDQSQHRWRCFPARVTRPRRAHAHQALPPRPVNARPHQSPTMPTTRSGRASRLARLTRAHQSSVGVATPDEVSQSPRGE